MSPPSFRAQGTRLPLAYPMALNLSVRLISAAKRLIFRRRQKDSRTLSNVPFIASFIFTRITFLPLLQTQLKRSPNFKRQRRPSSTSTTIYNLDPTEFAFYAAQGRMVERCIASPSVQIKSRNGFSTSSFLEDQVENSTTYSTSSYSENGSSLRLPSLTLGELPPVLSGPTEPTDIKYLQAINPEVTKQAQHAFRWRRKVKLAISHKWFAC